MRGTFKKSISQNGVKSDITSYMHREKNTQKEKWEILQQDVNHHRSRIRQSLNVSLSKPKFRRTEQE